MANWASKGLCNVLQLDRELFFPEGRRSPAAKKARTYCNVCPVREDCLAEALANPDTAGIWGGLDEVERGVLHSRNYRNGKR